MRTTTVPAGLRVLVVVGLAGAWCIGFLAQRAVVEETEYLDIPPALLVLGIAQCVAAGAASYVLAPAHRVVRTGVLAGLAMAALMVGGYLLLALAYADRFAGEESGETWLSLLFESWFWIGLPALSSATLGAIGWLGAATLHRRSHQGRRHHAHA